MEIRVIPTAIPEVVVVETEFRKDERGFFVETYHRQRYAAAGLDADLVQDNHSRSGKGVLRGIHYQGPPAAMVKLVRCTAGAILDVAVDLRVGSPTFGRWVAEELTAENMRQLWVPVGFGHAFLTLSEFAEVQYKCSAYYAPEVEGAVAWDDPDLGIDWPVAAPVLSARDQRAMRLREYLERPTFHYGPGE
jgi:dTDP-4-dehydrorhamnose 3,5-epimerase